MKMTPRFYSSLAVASMALASRVQAFAPLRVRSSNSYSLHRTLSTTSSTATTTSSTTLSATFDPLFFEHVATGGALACVGDVMAQTLTGRSNKNELQVPPQDWDRVRTGALAVFGAGYTGGVQHFIFQFLNGSVDDPIQRLLLAQFVFIPFCYYPAFVATVPALRAAFGEEDREQLVQDILGRLPATLVRNWTFWIPVQYIQFNYIPADLQVTYCAMFGVVWNAILSWSTLQASSVIRVNELEATPQNEPTVTLPREPVNSR